MARQARTIGRSEPRMRRAAACFLSAAAVIAAGALAPPAPAATAAFVRVDQVGYPGVSAKRAYLMSRQQETGAPYSVRSSTGQVVLSGTVGASLGSWSRRFGHVYALDFDAVTGSGTYTLLVGGRRPASSPPFAVGPAQQIYETPLANALSFYRDERDGPEYIPSALRTAPAHLDDASAMTYLTPKVNREGQFKGELTSLGASIDASGGWWDAGDYLKFVETASYAVSLQLIGVRDFPAQMGSSSPSSDFTEEARFGVEWLLRMWDDRTGTLYYQVGIGAGNSETVSDHDIWRLPQQDETYGGEDPRYRFIRHPPVFRAAPPGSPVSPNLAGRDAAAFALCFQVFAGTRPALASRCLLAGEHIFQLADTEPHGELLTAIPFGFYPESEWRDDLELGAAELSRALASGAPLPAGLPHGEASYYLQLAGHWAREYIAREAGAGEGLNLYDVSGLAHFELATALRVQGEPPDSAVTVDELTEDLGAKLHAAVLQSARDPFGFGFPWASADTVSHGDGLAVMASEYDALTGTPAYAVFAARWLGNVLGANAWGSSFIIGDGDVYPDCPQHQVANIAGSLDGSPPVLAGAVVEGPSESASGGSLSGMRACPVGGGDAFAQFDNRAVFRDDVQSYTNTEPAIDLTASSMLAFSWQSDPQGPALAGALDDPVP